MDKKIVNKLQISARIQTNERKSTVSKRKRASRYNDEETVGWVECLNCFHEYYIESVEITDGCPMCESMEYDVTETEESYFYY